MTATNFLKNWRKNIIMTEYKVITLPLVHGIPAACDDAAAGIVESFNDEVDLAAQHITLL